MYQLNGYASDFHTGQVLDGRQVLMGLLCPELAAYFFSSTGTLLHCEVRTWRYPAPHRGENGPYNIYDAEFERHLADQMTDWQRDLGFTSQAIRVEEFFDEERYVGIKAQLLEDPDEDEEVVEEQREQGMYEFYWAKDYLMSADGRVEAT